MHQTDELRYDVDGFVPGGGVVGIGDGIRFESVPAGGGAAVVGSTESASVAVRGAGWAHIRSTTGSVDHVGNRARVQIGGTDFWVREATAFTAARLAAVVELGDDQGSTRSATEQRFEYDLRQPTSTAGTRSQHFSRPPGRPGPRSEPEDEPMTTAIDQQMCELAELRLPDLQRGSRRSSARSRVPRTSGGCCDVSLRLSRRSRRKTPASCPRPSLESRMGLIRRALQGYLASAGEKEVATMLGDRPQAADADGRDQGRAWNPR